ncbi:methyl-accepting chemotaxis protein, partial [bacterium]|nr:methyl-accepting chemotaxis protein [bacterium]
MNSGNNSNIMRNDNDVQKAIIEKIMFDEKDSKNKNKSKNLGKDKNFDDFSLKIKEMGKDLLDTNKSITTFIKNIFKINDNILSVNDSSKELIEYINKLEKSFINLSKVYIKFFEKIDLFNESLSNITISITNVNKETKPFINNIDKMGISIEKTSSSARDSIDILVNLSNSLDQLTKKMNNQKNSIDNISVSIENYDTLLKSSNKINSDNIFKLDDKMTKYNKSIKNEINNLFDNHVIKYFTDKLHETGNVWRNRIKDLFYGISNRINSLYEDIKKNALMNINSNNIIKNSSPAISSVNLPPPLPIKREASVGETIKNLPSLNNIVPSSVNASDNSIVYYLKNIQESMNENYKKIIKKIGKDEDLNETLNKSKPLMEQLVMKKTPEGVSINWLYKQLFTNGIKIKGGSGGSGGGGFLSGPRNLLSNLWNGLTEPIVAGALIFRDEIKRAVSSVFSLPKKLIDGSNFLLHNSIFRFTAGLTGVGFAINDAYEGWKSAAEWFKKPQNELNMEEKAIAAFSGLVGGTEKGLKNALGQGVKWAAIGNMFAPGIGAIIGGAIGLVSGYVGGEAIANFLKNVWDGAKVAFSNFADWVSEVWNTKYEDDKTVRDRMINNGKIIEKFESEVLKEEDKLFNMFSSRLEDFKKRRTELFKELDNLLSGIVKLNKKHFDDMNVLTDQYLHPVEPRKFVDLQDRYLNNKNMRNDQLLRQEELQDKRDTLRSLTLSKQVPIEKKSLVPQSHGKISNANEMYHEYLKKKKQEELQDERDFQRSFVLSKQIPITEKPIKTEKPDSLSIGKYPNIAKSNIEIANTEQIAEDLSKIISENNFKMPDNAFLATIFSAITSLFFLKDTNKTLSGTLVTAAATLSSTSVMANNLIKENKEKLENSPDGLEKEILKKKLLEEQIRRKKEIADIQEAWDEYSEETYRNNIDEQERKIKQEKLQDARDFQRENVLFKKQEVHYNEYMKSIKQNDSNFGNINPDQVIQAAPKIIEGAGVSPFYEQIQEAFENAQSNEPLDQTSDKLSEEMKEYNKKLQEAIESGQAFKPVSIAELKDVEKMGKKAITPGSIYTHDIHVEKNMSNLFKNLLGFLEINFINLLESKIFKNKTENKTENESSTVSNVAKSIFNIIKNINNTSKIIISKITDVFLNNFKLLLNIQDENSKDFAYLGDMGKKSTTPGSIYTHDIHLEGFFSKFLKNIDRMIINQEELNKLIKEFKSMEESEIETETKGYVTTTKKSSESST